MTESRLGRFTGPVIALCLALMTGLVPGLAQSAAQAQSAPIEVAQAAPATMSGASGNTNEDAKVFGDYRGDPQDIINVFGEWSSWDMVEPDYIRDNLSKPGAPRFTGTVMVSTGLWPVYPDRTYQQHMQACAAGKYYTQWQKFGRWAQSMPNRIIARIGWEANGRWYPWAADTTHDRDAWGNYTPITPQQIEEWRGCFRSVALAIKSTSEDHKVLIDWSVNKGVGGEHAPDDQYLLYPGDDVVDVISVNMYDQYPHGSNDEERNAQFNWRGGVGDLVRFAAARGKRWGLAEWGVSRNGGNDSSDFIIWAWRVIKFLNPFYEIYHQDPIIASTLWPDATNPRSSGAYRFLWRL